ncbi:MAG: hypothetical protein VKP72_10365 [bacterium]|nr:hypothetical protein [bacterium]
MTRLRTKTGTSMLLWGTLTACVATAPPSSVSSLEGQPITPVASARAHAGTGQLLLKVRWPGRANQFIPAGTRRIEIDVARRGESVAGPVVATEGADVRIERLPPGTLELSARAYDSPTTGGRLRATGTASVEIVPNRLTPGRLTLVPSVPLAVLDTFPASLVPGTGPKSQLNVRVQGFDLVSSRDIQVYVGNTLIPNGEIRDAQGRSPSGPIWQWINHLSPDQPAYVAIRTPRDIETGPVKVVAGPYSATGTATFTPIGSVSLRVQTVRLVPGEEYLFEVDTYDRAGNPLPCPPEELEWRIQDETCLGNRCDDNDAARVNSGLVRAELDIGWFSNGKNVTPTGDVIGIATIRVGNLYCHATASIVVVGP